MKNVRLLSVLALVGLLVMSCATTFTPVAPNTKGLSFDEAVNVLNTPEKINAWMLRNLAWKSRSRAWYSPEQMYEKRIGSCIGWANLAAYLLDHNGYEVKVVFGRYASLTMSTSGHAVCAYKKDGKWYVAGDSRGRVGSPVSFGIGAGSFNSLKEVAEHATMPYGLADYTVDGSFLTFVPKNLMKRYEDVKLNWPK